LVLAAGSAGRMGQFKPLLDLGGQPIIVRVIETFFAAGIADVRVVIGHNKDLLLPVLREMGVRAVINDDYNGGMFSSVKAGVRSLEQNTGAFFVLPADVPLISPSTIRFIEGSLVPGADKIVIPCFEGRDGHPPLISSVFARSIIEYDGEGGLQGFLKEHKDSILTVSVQDRNVLFDVDEPADYEELKRRWIQRGIDEVAGSGNV
jgi:molybdenum cofactor cytidylyltransferase